MTEKLCQTCRHWIMPNAWEADNAGMRKCAAIRQAWDVADDVFQSKQRYDYEDWTEVERLEADALRNAKAVARDGSDYHAEVWTVADFGCLLWASGDAP